MLALAFGLSARAESPREELVHAFHLLKTANSDYNGHRVLAMTELQVAGASLGLALGGDLPMAERQWQSDAQLTEARRLLMEASLKLEVSDRQRVAAHVNKAITEINFALATHPPIVPHPAIIVPVEAPREELVHAFRLLKTANSNYNGHKASAMAEVEAAGHSLGLDLGGDLAVVERQWQSDVQLTEARRLLMDARNKLEQSDRDRAAAHLDRALNELALALRVR